MSRLITHLTFNGNCQQAMLFYHQCLGGKLYFQRVADSPESKKLPKSMHELILLARLECDTFQLMGSDLVGDKGLSKGNNVSIWLEAPTEKETRRIFHQLGRKGKTEFPLQENSSGHLFGGLKDQFGLHWLLYSNIKTRST